MTAVVDDITIPDTPEGLTDLLNDGPKMERIVAGGKLKDVVQAYAASIHKKDKDLDAQIRDGVEKGLAEFIAQSREKGAKPPVNLDVNGLRPGMTVARGKGAAHNKNAPGAKADGIFADQQSFFQAVAYGGGLKAIQSRPDLLDQIEKLHGIQNAFGSTVPADGGFLIPETLRSEILQVALEQSIIRPRATVIPMDSLRVPIPMIDSTTDSGSVLGGVQVFWTEESAALTSTQASFGRVVLDAKKLTAYSDVPNELPADAPAFMSVFDSLFPRAIAFEEDYQFFNGSGVGKPLGWVGCPAAVVYDAAVSSQIAWTDVVGMFARMLPTSLGNAVWICSPKVFPQLANMTFGSGSFPALFSVGGGSNALTLSLLGRPLVISEKAPNLGTNGALSFVDLSYYLVGDRQVMQAAMSTEYKFGNDQTSFRLIERVDGRPWIQSAITPANGGDTLTPFVELSGLHT